jgi:hypothetical protein
MSYLATEEFLDRIDSLLPSSFIGYLVSTLAF